MQTADASSTTRRILLAKAAAGAALAAVPAGVTLAGDGTPDMIDPHPAWGAESARLKAVAHEALYRGDLDDEEAFDASSAAINNLDGMIVDTPAQTIAGVREQLRFLVQGLGQDDGSWNYKALKNALATVERLAGSAAHA